MAADHARLASFYARAADADRTLARDLRREGNRERRRFPNTSSATRDRARDARGRARLYGAAALAHGILAGA